MAAGRGGAPWALYEFSDGKPCSGVRGCQQASTDFHTGILRGNLDVFCESAWIIFHEWEFSKRNIPHDTGMPT